jgi:cytochrome c-type protein NapB
MKLSNKLIFLFILTLAFLWSCSSKKATVETEATAVAKEVKEETQLADEATTLISENEIGYRSEDLLNEEFVIPKIDYTAGAPGTVGNWERSFENAPPMIPHTMEGFVPIKAGVNACLACHLPAVAAALKATAMPKSHFTDYRPEVIEQNGLYQVDAKEGEVISKDLGANYNLARYNCTQCHAPQANTTVFIDNQFNPLFRGEEDAKKTNLSEIIDEGVK